MKPYRLTFTLKAIVTAAALITVLGTAAMIHVPWYYTSKANIKQTVDEINRQIINGISQEVSGILSSAMGALQSVHTILFQRVIAVTHPAKREFLFLAHVQSHPSISWVSFGWPNGDFFGAHRPRDDYIQMVETTWDPEAKSAQRRIDHYDVGEGDIWFQKREFMDSGFNAAMRPWYRRAVESDLPLWTDVYTLPVSGKAAISVASKLVIFDELVGVINVAIALDRVSLYLQTLRVGKTGTVFIVNEREELIASQDPVTMPDVVAEGDEPMLMKVSDAAYPFLNIAYSALQSHGLEIADIRQPRQLMQEDPELKDRHFVTFAPLDHKGWVVATVIPESDFLDAIDRNTRHLLFEVVFLTAMVAAVTIWVSHSTIVDSLTRITAQIKHVEDFELRQTTEIPSRIQEVQLLSSAMVRMTRGLAAFQRYLPTALVRTLISKGIESKPQSRTATIMFTDLAGFTSLAERMSPERVVALLNEYFSVVTKPIEKSGGVITQYQGDAILTVFNVPTDDPDHARHAVRTAVEIQDLLKNKTFLDGITLRTRIGINTGYVVAGSVGSQDRVNYTVHGDAVNLAARLEALNKEYQSDVLVSQTTVDLLGDEFSLETIGEVSIRGKEAAVTIYKLVGADV